ncbi:MAG: bifunctional (p)ppGpp synthetase/guanosine-3',5'-bis(diphosphate) 3'-pyrophosphohydrolase, partial [Halioglobus sp.]|nr:bifunctional (p)ppGpp synthetase/guanosine-3',5'-bis(diphosphate) 3'-pyrophosphohydrolase [Halioglobus sp.]
IRTREMEDMANNGIAAHWLYKSDGQSTNGSHARAREWVQGLLEMQQRAGDSLEFIESVKIDLFPDEIYVFTPKGRILELPRGATAVDFAYAVHTDVGNSCVACRINRRLAPLSEPLESGQTVEILTSAGARPNPSWLDYAVTAKARSNIHHFLKNQTRDDSVALGRTLLQKSLASFGSSLEQLPEDDLGAFLLQHHYQQLDDLLVDVARGNRLPTITAQQLLSELDASPQQERDNLPVAICGTEGFMVSYARCCHPIPGDAIEGYLSSEKGVVVHREECNNLADKRETSERLVALRWDEEVVGEYLVDLRVEVENRRGMIAVIATRINSMGVNIEKISTDSKDYQFTYVNMEMLVQNRVHLARIMKRLRSINHVRKVTRTKH